MLESLLNIDESLFQFINQSMSNSILDSLLVPIRHPLFWIPLYIFLILFISINFVKRKWLIYASIAFTIFLSDTTSSKIIKNAFQRTRPCHIEYLQTNSLVHCGHGYSFTSSHACNHFAIGTLFFLLFSFTKWRYAFLVWAAVISFAQVYVGQHFPLDIIFGGIIGMIIGGIVFLAFKKLENTIYTTHDSHTA